MVLRHGVYLPPFGELADPRVLAELAAEAETAGFDGVFLWDHVARPQEPGLAVGDAWIGLAAIAAATRRVVLGPRVTPLSRRRPQDVARASVALDQLSDGRFALGVGLGSDATGEFTRLGEVTAPRERAKRLDEALTVLTALWSGEIVDHPGPAFPVDGLQFLPRPLQRPRIPIWVAAQSVRQAPLRRAARYDGLCPEATPAELAAMLAIVAEHRGGDLTGYDVVVAGPADDEYAAYERAGATWWLTQLPVGVTLAAARARLRAGPP
ncbi:LLM class flavin-dependent oxidoreductase [Nocardia neocaledoniensis]|uniref:LLM class flavin-dependent oxidoreductase n=1 Tax=Nocardia neocaledoniensis TaxID=236511 RepID=UPI002455A9FF|nr:LLM class flavin-dependent oxidoreductase [Nocardia neocaledoniensis]